MLFKVMGWLVWGIWAWLAVLGATQESTPRAGRIAGALVAVLGASWTLWALVRG